MLYWHSSRNLGFSQCFLLVSLGFVGPPISTYTIIWYLMAARNSHIERELVTGVTVFNCFMVILS